jgi:hypothetical protein
MHLKKLGIALVALCPIAVVAQDAAVDPAPVDPVEQYASVLRETRGLVAYNALVRRQLQMQQQDLLNLQAAILAVPDLERQLPPLLINMVDGLEDFVDLDLPFLVEERQDRVADLSLMIEDPDVADGQKLRRILDAWSIEVEFGSAFHTETGQVLIDGAEREVDYVILGRVGLLAQTNDEEALTLAWDHANGQWLTLGSEHRNPVRQAIRMARSQVAPDLLLLPTSPPER